MATILIIGVLSAFVVPEVTSWIKRAEYIRAAQDLDSTRRAIILFNLNTTAYPDQVKHLYEPITTTDLQFNQLPYSAGQVARWKGPYVSGSVDPVTGVLRTTLGIEILQFFSWFSTVLNAEAAGPESADWVAIKTSEITSTDFEEINDIIDGEAEPDGSGPNQSQLIGKLRLVPQFPPVSGGQVVSGNMFYLATPHRR